MAYDIAKRFKNNGVVTTIDNITYAGYKKLVNKYVCKINRPRGIVMFSGDHDTVVVELAYWNEIAKAYEG